MINCLCDSIDEIRGDADDQIAEASSRWLPAVNGALSSKLVSLSGLHVSGQVQVYGLRPLAWAERIATMPIHCVVRLNAVQVPQPCHQCAPPLPLWSTEGNNFLRLSLQVMNDGIHTVRNP